MAQMKSKLYLPALKGVFGKWFYYSVLMPVTELAERVSFAKELHNNRGLSELIQRELKKGRPAEIAEYIKREEDRFFNSLVVAVYDGNPAWHPAAIKSTRQQLNVEAMPDELKRSIGILSLEGNERLFAVDGQHRLAGIKEAVASARASGQPDQWGEHFLDDEVSVLFIGHETSRAGLERTRRVFTTLNKTARPVSKGETIALDENDAMAIISRRLVEEHSFFKEPRVAIRATNNLAPNDVTSLITIGALYDVLAILFTKMMPNRKSLRELRFGNRPSAAELDVYYRFASKYFTWLGEEIAELGEYFRARSPRRIIAKYRGSKGGHLAFRPIGLLVITAVVARLVQGQTLRAAIRRVAELSFDLDASPLAKVLWNPATRTIQASNRVLATNVYLAKFGCLSKKQLGSVTKRYKELTGSNF